MTEREMRLNDAGRACVLVPVDEANASGDELLAELWKKIIGYPAPRVCKHLIVANLLSDMEEIGFEIPEELARAVVECDDETALSFGPLVRKK